MGVLTMGFGVRNNSYIENNRFHPPRITPIDPDDGIKKKTKKKTLVCYFKKKKNETKRGYLTYLFKKKKN